MKISKRAQYGLTAMVHLARNEKAKSSKHCRKAVSVRELSNIEAVPYAFLCKIF